ncbi:DUF397 domain-containing protein [Streptomyces sp. A3M-1-3]|nr:DUF397 domain-containing protein [Streptomyces sp. A3M-1-3]
MALPQSRTRPGGTSSYGTGSGGECVDLAVTAAAVQVRDSKHVLQAGRS